MSKTRQARRRAERTRLEQERRASRQQRRVLSRSQELLAVESYDTHAGLRYALAEVAKNKDEWAGIPMPIDDFPLVVEPSYKFAELFAKLGQKPESGKYEGWKVRNSWYSSHKRSDIVVVEKPDGEITWMWKPAFHSIAMQLGTLGASDVWGIEQEHRALELLGTMLRHRTFKMYLMTGMFLEKSDRSGVTYLFRRLRPTIAMAANPGFAEDHPNNVEMRGLAALCMHPIAYYDTTWAGAMCPTDDVIAHLSMMRGDEKMFWKRCNQHPLYRPEAGL